MQSPWIPQMTKSNKIFSVPLSEIIEMSEIHHCHVPPTAGRPVEETPRELFRTIMIAGGDIEWNCCHPSLQCTRHSVTMCKQCGRGRSMDHLETMVNMFQWQWECDDSRNEYQIIGSWNGVALRLEDSMVGSKTHHEIDVDQ